MSNQRNSPNQSHHLPRPPTVHGQALQQAPRLQQTMQGQQAPAKLREMVAAHQQQQQGYPAQVYPQTQQGYPQAQYQGYQAQPQQQAQQGYPQAQYQGYQAQPQGYPQAQYPQGAIGTPMESPTTNPQTMGRKIRGADASSGSPGRVRFIRLTYLHLMMAILAFTGLSWLLMHNATLSKLVAAPVIKFALGGRWNWSIFLGLFIGAGYLADSWAQRRGNKLVQYMGLALYVVAEAVIFMPLLYKAELAGAAIMAQGGGDPHFIRDAAYISMALFSALTLSVFITKKDFSYLRSGLMMFSASALVLVYISLAAGFNLGVIFSFAMVFLAGGYVLYYTSQILAHYDHGSHVAASLALFSALALMFWYVIRILMKMRE